MESPERPAALALFQGLATKGMFGIDTWPGQQPAVTDSSKTDDLFPFLMKASEQFYSIVCFAQISEIQTPPSIPREEAAHTKNQADLQQ